MEWGCSQLLVEYKPQFDSIWLNLFNIFFLIFLESYRRHTEFEFCLSYSFTILPSLQPIKYYIRLIHLWKFYRFILFWFLFHGIKLKFDLTSRSPIEENIVINKITFFFQILIQFLISIMLLSVISIGFYL